MWEFLFSVLLRQQNFHPYKTTLPLREDIFLRVRLLPDKFSLSLATSHLYTLNYKIILGFQLINSVILPYKQG